MTAVPQAHSSPKNYHSAIEADQADQLMGKNIMSSVGPVLGALLLWGIFYYARRDVMVLYWAALMHAIQAVRIVMHVNYLRVPRQYRQPMAAIVGYRRMLITTGFVWGLAPCMYFPAGNLPLTGLMLLMLVGMIVTRLAWLSLYRPAIFWFVVPNLS